MGKGTCAEAQYTAQATIQNNPQPLSKGISHKVQLIPCLNGIKSKKQNISIHLPFFSPNGFAFFKDQ